MTKGEAHQTKLHYKGSEDDFIVFVDDVGTFKKWKEDKSIPLAHFVSTFQVFLSHKQGAQGTLDSASNTVLDNEFSTHNIDEVIKLILEKGSSQESEMSERTGVTNESNGVRQGH